MADNREQRIRERAHAIWEQEGRPHGRDEDHWRQASQEVGGDMFDQPGVTENQERAGSLDGGLLPAGGLVAAGGPAGLGLAGLGMTGAPADSDGERTEGSD
jgi:hypothetical protein